MRGVTARSTAGRVMSTCAALVAVLVASPAKAQRLAASYGFAHSNSDLIGTLGGYDLELTTPRAGAASGTFSFGRHTGNHMRNGIACSGLIPPPPACPVEPLRDETTATSVSGALDVTLFQEDVFRGRIGGTVSFGAQMLHLKSSSRGETTGNGIGAEQTKVGPTVGFELIAQPNGAVPVGLRFGVAGGLFVLPNSGAVDGYAPFDGGFSVIRLDVGLVWSLRR